MATIFSELGVADNERIFRAVDGQTVIETLSNYATRLNEELSAASGIFLGVETESYTERAYKPGTGEMSETAVGDTGPAVRATGSWTVSYPIRNFAEGIVSTDVDMAHMTAADLDRHTTTVSNRWVTRHRKEMMRAIFRNAARTFKDPRHGDLTLQPLANEDGTAYPPVIGSEDEAQANHYVVSGYTSANVSDVNNPLVTISDQLEDHFGQASNGGQVVVFINRAERGVVSALTDFVSRAQVNINYGDDTNLALPEGITLPGRVLGVLDEYGVWVVQWDQGVPSGYMLGLHLGSEGPLARRVDPQDTGLPRGLHLAGGGNDPQYPMVGMFYRDRFGYAVRNRLNGMVVQLKASGTYDIPALYA